MAREIQRQREGDKRPVEKSNVVLGSFEKTVIVQPKRTERPPLVKGPAKNLEWRNKLKDEKVKVLKPRLRRNYSRQNYSRQKARFQIRLGTWFANIIIVSMLLVMGSVTYRAASALFAGRPLTSVELFRLPFVKAPSKSSKPEGLKNQPKFRYDRARGEPRNRG